MCEKTDLADTLVVKETHSLTNVSGVVPVMSSHCAGVVPPKHKQSKRKCAYMQTYFCSMLGVIYTKLELGYMKIFTYFVKLILLQLWLDNEKSDWLL